MSLPLLLLPSACCGLLRLLTAPCHRILQLRLLRFDIGQIAMMLPLLPLLLLRLWHQLLLLFVLLLCLLLLWRQLLLLCLLLLWRQLLLLCLLLLLSLLRSGIQQPRAPPLQWSLHS